MWYVLTGKVFAAVGMFRVCFGAGCAERLIFPSMYERVVG